MSKPLAFSTGYLDELLKHADSDFVFDAVCLNNYMAGQLGLKIPVDDSRLVFSHIKKMLRRKRPGRRK